MPTYVITGSRAAGSAADVPPCIVTAKRGTRRDDQVSCANVIAGHVFTFMRRHPAVAVVEESIGARSPVA